MLNEINLYSSNNPASAKSENGSFLLLPDLKAFLVIVFIGLSLYTSFLD